MSETWRFDTIEHIADIDPDTWDHLFNDYPFTRHAFLHALEASGSVGGTTGWRPLHIVAYQENRLVFAMPGYLKYHSYGEYVFDWSWADAYQRHGLEYYPKYINAIPFTPATGPRFGCLNDPVDLEALQQFIKQLLAERQLSGHHLLFPQAETTEPWLASDWVARRGVQFHWYNQQYQTFEDFLDGFTSRKRKNLKRERRRITEQQLVCETVTGDQASTEQWQRFFECYQMTYLKRSGHGGYLNKGFFDRIAAQMGDQIVLMFARHEGDIIASALCFADQQHLYGRYWGCLQDFDQLHFELCYYRGIEYCIEKGLSHFDPGAQGEHKIQRGFSPIHTWSLHHLRDPEFHRAVADFCLREAQHNEDYLAAARELLPFKSNA